MSSVCSTTRSIIALCDSPVDWSATGDFWSGVGTLVAAGAVIWTAVEAKGALSDWKAQKISERTIAQAERILEAAYRAKDALEYVRGNLRSDERESAKDAVVRRVGMRPFPGDGGYMSPNTQARMVRLDGVTSAQDDLLQCRPMAKAFFGDKLYEAITVLHGQFGTVRRLLEADQSVEFEPQKGSIGSALKAISPDVQRRKKITDLTQSSISTIEGECLPVLRNTDAK